MLGTGYSILFVSEITKLVVAMFVRGIPFRNSMIIAALLVLAAALSACANKAKVIQAGAKQMEVESLTAINKIDELRLAELQVSPPLPEEDATRFAKTILRSSKPINAKRVELAANPFALNTPKSDAA